MVSIKSLVRDAVADAEADLCICEVSVVVDATPGGLGRVGVVQRDPACPVPHPSV